MTQELLYTSVPRGLRPGSRGFCTVASTNGMAAPMATFLESLSAYRAVFSPNDPRASLNPVNFSHLIGRVAGKNYSVLSRVADYGLDYSQRSNKLAHHVVLNPEERVPAGPAAVLSQTGFMETGWKGEPRILSVERSVPLLADSSGVCRAWQETIGDAGWAGVLAEAFLENPHGLAYLVYEPGSEMLPLISEAIRLLPVERRWEVTFSTYFTRLPKGVSCQWRCVLADSTEESESRRFAGALKLNLCRPLGPAAGGPLVEKARTGRTSVSPAPPLSPAESPAATAAAPEDVEFEELVDDAMNEAHSQRSPTRGDQGTYAVSQPPTGAPLPPGMPPPPPPPRRKRSGLKIAGIFTVATLLLCAIGGGVFYFNVFDVRDSVNTEEIAGADADRSDEPKVKRQSDTQKKKSVGHKDSSKKKVLKTKLTGNINPSKPTPNVDAKSKKDGDDTRPSNVTPSKSKDEHAQNGTHNNKKKATKDNGSLKPLEYVALPDKKDSKVPEYLGTAFKKDAKDYELRLHVPNGVSLQGIKGEGKHSGTLSAKSKNTIPTVKVAIFSLAKNGSRDDFQIVEFQWKKRSFRKALRWCILSVESKSKSNFSKWLVLQEKYPDSYPSNRQLENGKLIWKLSREKLKKSSKRYPTFLVDRIVLKLKEKDEQFEFRRDKKTSGQAQILSSSEFANFALRYVELKKRNQRPEEWPGVRILFKCDKDNKSQAHLTLLPQKDVLKKMRERLDNEILKPIRITLQKYELKINKKTDKTKRLVDSLFKDSASNSQKSGKNLRKKLKNFQELKKPEREQLVNELKTRIESWLEKHKKKIEKMEKSESDRPGQMVLKKHIEKVKEAKTKLDAAKRSADRLNELEKSIKSAHIIAARIYYEVPVGSGPPIEVPVIDFDDRNKEK